MTHAHPVGSRPQPVVQIVQHLAPGGLETLALALDRSLALEAETHLVALEGEVIEAMARWPMLRGHASRLHLLGKRPGLSPSLVLRLAWLLRRLNAGTVLTHHIGPLFYGGLAARLAGVPRVIHTEHDCWHLEDQEERGLQARLLRRVRPVLVAHGKAAADRLAALFPDQQRPLVVPSGVDTNRFCPGDPLRARLSLGLPIGVPIIGTAARLTAVKGVDVFLEAMAQLPRGIHGVIAGDGPDRAALQHRAEALGISHRIHFLGTVSDMPTLYQALDVFCLASRQEGQPVAALEAQACGRRVVLTAVGDVSETLEPMAGRLVHPGDARQLTIALAEELRQALPLAGAPVASARAFVEERRSLTQMVDGYRALLAA
ncbi:MAG: glycosyltransferase [Alphaproteobacteria bacterium]|nr:MAG: glycosyltransferase [Alphaproteobacteria bacterium]